MMYPDFDWEVLLKAQLERLPKNVQAGKRIVAWDLDQSLWLDILVELLKQFGTIDSSTGQKRWIEYDYAYKVRGTMTNGQHLVMEYKDLLSQHALGELIEYAKNKVPLIPGALEFKQFLDSMGIGMVAISNGARQIAEAKLAHHQLDFPLVSNWFDGDELRFLHDEHVGIDKGCIVDKLAEWGWIVVAFGGDAQGDIAGAAAAHKLGALVFACGYGGLFHWCDRHLPLSGWVHYDHFRTVISALQSRLCGA